MRIFFVTFGILMLAAFSESAYLRNFPVQVRQPDGTVVDCFASGDEFYNWLHDSAGRTIVQDPKTGWHVYALKIKGRLVPSAYIVNKVRIQTLSIPAFQVQDFKFRLSPQVLFPNGSPSSLDEIINAPRKGSTNNLVIFIRFSDESEFEDASSFYDTMFNASTAGTNSLFNYFQDVSYNQLGMTATFYPLPGGTTVISYQDSHPRSYYQPYNEATNPGGYSEDQRTTREHTLLKDCVNAVSSQVPAGLALDGDNDGHVDNVCFIIKGSPGAWSHLLWPHMWSLYSYSVFINSKRVYTYNFQLQSSLKSGGGNVGVLCHEMFHTLGSPDLYHYSFDGLNPVGTWDIMEHNSNAPQHMGAYMKYRYGTWIPPIPVITTSGIYALNPLTSSSGNCYKIASPNSGSEYFVIEYRKKTSFFENSLPGEGLLVYRINTAKDGQGNRNGPPDEVYIYRPGGTITQNGTYGSAHFSSEAGRVQINDTTDPSGFLSDGNPGGLDISAIGSASGTILFTVILRDNPRIALSRTALNFGAWVGDAKTPDQSFTVSNSGTGTLNWTVIDNASWLDCTPASGTGNQIITVSVNASGLGGGTFTGAITVLSADAANSPQTVSVTLKVYAAGGDSGPFGAFDTPTAGSTVSGSVAVTGWALDDIGVKRVEIKREPDPDDPAGAIGSDGLVYIGDALFVKGSRTDVEALYPSYPHNDKAGWGYMMLTYGLPRKGNGTFRLYAIAEDLGGNKTRLGTKQITSDNAHRVKPFGTIDTPDQGGVVSGTSYVNFGWALTPLPNMIPTDGSTIWVTVDSVFLGHPVYNQYRVDVATSFPECLNNNGAVGYYFIDTTKYANGVHTIGWLATDNAGNVDGMGSRFFEIQNIGGEATGLGKLEPVEYIEDTSGTLKIDVLGPAAVIVEELGSVEIVLRGTGGNRFIGWGADQSKNLPLGSTLDKEAGIFYWTPAAGFLGKHILHFSVTDGVRMSQPVTVAVTIVPKKYDEAPARNRTNLRQQNNKKIT